MREPGGGGISTGCGATLMLWDPAVGGAPVVGTPDGLDEPTPPGVDDVPTEGGGGASTVGGGATGVAPPVGVGVGRGAAGGVT